MDGLRSARIAITALLTTALLTGCAGKGIASTNNKSHLKPSPQFTIISVETDRVNSFDYYTIKEKSTGNLYLLVEQTKTGSVTITSLGETSVE